MKNLSIILVVLGVLIFASPMNAQITFERWYGGADSEAGRSVAQTSDGGYIVAGWTTSYGAGSVDVYLIKTDSLGDTLWTRTYGGTDTDWGRSVAQTSDGGYIIAGETDSYGTGSSDVYLIKTDSLGDTLWTRTYWGTGWDFGHSVAQTSDGGYIIAGETESYGANLKDVYLIKTDSLGDTLWTRTYGGTPSDIGYSAAQTSDGGYIATGYTRSYGAGWSDVYLIKTDTNGDTLWTRTYGSTSGDIGYSVTQTSDGGYIIAGETQSYGAGLRDVYLVKTDSLGDTLWTRTYGGTSDDIGYSAAQTSDGGYIVAGWTNSYGAGSRDVYLVKTDSLGDTLWTRTYGGTPLDIGYSVAQTSDGGYIVAGFGSYGASISDVYLIKTDSEGNVGVQENRREVTRSPKLVVSPNPFRDRIDIKYCTEHSAKGIELKIYDAVGRLVKNFILYPSSFILPAKLEWDGIDNKGCNALPGVYFIRLSSGDFTSVKKVILVR